MSHKFKYRPPAAGELEAAPIHWVGFNPYWWELAQGQIGNLAIPALWEDYTQDIDTAIHRLMLPGELPESPIWCHVFDFRTGITHDWTAEQGGMSLVEMGWQGGTSGGKRAIRITRDFTSSTILSVSVLHRNSLNATATAFISKNNNAGDIYRNTNQPTGNWRELVGCGRHENVTNLKIEIGAVGGTSGLAIIHTVIVVGEGTTPF